MPVDGSMSGEQNFCYRYVQKYTEICFQNAPRIQFLGAQKWCSANVFSDTKQIHVCWNICKVFRVKLYCKMSDLFASFCWLWDFLLENLKFKKKNSDDVHWNMWTSIKKLYVWNSIFKKRMSDMRFWIIYILVQISFVWWIPSGCFSQCFVS